MERIQSALAKARAAREGHNPGQGPGHSPGRPRTAVPQQPSPGDEARQAAWQALPEVRLDRKRLLKKRITAFESSRGSTEFDKLRSRIRAMAEPRGWRKIAIISPTAQNGKSTVSANLAFSMARQSHRNIMLLECDLRRPGLASMLGLSDSLDLSRVLAGKANLAHHAVRFGENLAVAPSHPVRGGAAEFLQSPTTAEALDEIVAIYDPAIMLFDMPPMGVGDDVIGFLGRVDCALIVAAAGRTTLDQIDACEREVAQLTNVLGVVLNKCRFEGQASEEYDYY